MQDLIPFLHELADAAAAITLPAFRNSASENKGGNFYDPVTAADRDAEAAIRTLIEARYPDHAILGEEHGHKKTDSPYQWVIDPIDGTRAFISGMPSWGTLIALTHNSISIGGVCDQPFTGERYFSDAKVSQLRHNKKTQQLATSACTQLALATIATTTPELFVATPAWEKWKAITAAAQLTRYGGDCYNYALLAGGQIDAVVEQLLNPYDILALVPIIEAAGGTITDWHGAPLTLNWNNEHGQAVAAATPTLHAALLKILQ